MSRKIEWLSILQGWSMLLVVVGHVTLTGIFGDTRYPIASTIERIIYSFHMPLFMFISGYLFYMTKIAKDKTYGDVILNKLLRLGIPYLFFTCLTFVPKILFPSLMNRPVDISIQYFINVFVLMKTNPLSEMWFIVALFILMMLYPLYKSILSKWSKIGGGILWVLLLIINLISPDNISLLQLSHVMEMGIYFYSGIIICCFGWIKMFKRWYLCAGLLCILLLGFYNKFPSVILSFAGIFFSISLCQFISGRTPNLFSSFRNYTYQIFLMGIFFQMAVRYLFKYIDNDMFYIPCYVLSILLAVYVPVLISKIIKKINCRPLMICFGLSK